MKKLAIIYLVLNILLSGCNKYEEPGKNVIYETTAPINTDVMAELEPQNDLWIDAYYYVMESRIFSDGYFYLLDIDFDGVPEMFTTCSRAGGTWIDHGFSFKNGHILDIQFEEPIPTDLELYKDVRTNKMVWIASGVIEDRASYSYVWQQIDFNDFSNVKRYPFFEWKEIRNEILDEGVPASYQVEYQLIDNDSNVISTSKYVIETQFQKVFSQYEQMMELHLFSSNLEFVNDENAYDYDLFRLFMQLYHTTTQDNSLDKSSDMLDLPVDYIRNENINNNYQFSDYRLSLITKGYSRIDGDAKVDINVKYIELNQYYNEDIRTKINQMLKEWAFFDWNVLTEKEIKLDIQQIPTFYKNYLSIQKLTDCKMEGVHPWYSLSATTIDIRSGEEIVLSDILIIDDRIKEKIYAGKFINDRFSDETCIEFGLYDQLYKAILNAADSTKVYQNNIFYLTDTEAIFIIDVSHTMGDYLTFKISYEDLADIWREGE